MEWLGYPEIHPLKEKLLNDLLTTTFGTPHGIETLKYLKSITTERVAGPEIKADALFHLEGQRFLVGVIETRIRQHQAAKEQTNE